MNEEIEHLTETEIADALNHEDGLGRLVSRAFSFVMAPFEEIIATASSSLEAKSALAAIARKEYC